MGKKKIRLKSSIKKGMIIIVGCICIFITIYYGVHIIFYEYSNKNESQQNIQSRINDMPDKDFPVEEDTGRNETEDINNIDVLAIGNSDLYSAFNPLQLWHEQGITSFVAAGPKQNTKLSYYMLKEVLKIEKPKLVILETDAFFGEYEDIDANGYQYTAQKYCYKLFENKDEWEMIRNEPYMKSEYLKNRMKLYGYYYNTQIKRCTTGFSYMEKSQKRAPFSSYTKKYLKEIIQLTDENNFQILFVCFPSESSWSYARHNAVSDYAKKCNIPFIDFNIEQYDTGFSWMFDSRDGGNHLNYTGATKMTRFLGKYLKSNYQIKDKRNDSAYAFWNKDYDEFIKEFIKN